MKFFGKKLKYNQNLDRKKNTFFLNPLLECPHCGGKCEHQWFKFFEAKMEPVKINYKNNFYFDDRTEFKFPGDLNQSELPISYDGYIKNDNFCYSRCKCCNEYVIWSFNGEVLYPTNIQATNKLEYHVFISYVVDESQELAEKLFNLLNEYDFKTWLDKKSILPGENFPLEIDRGIDSCKFGILLISDSYANRKWTIEELRKLNESNKSLIPILMTEKSNLPDEIKDLNYQTDDRPSEILRSLIRLSNKYF